MKQRCHNPRDAAYKWYGGRGITVCDRWLNSFEAFLVDMGEKPDLLTLDRVDGSKGYYKENCRWATLVEQAENRRSSRMFERGGKIQCLKRWADDVGMSYPKLYKRVVLRNWPFERAITEP